MLKKEIWEIVSQQLNSELETVTAAANQAHNTATHEESVAENKYDTFGLEASYLADGLSRRVEELKSAISQYDNPPWLDSELTEVALGAIVVLENLDTGVEQNVLFGPAGGGVKIEYNGAVYQVVTPSSPIGALLQGKEEGEDIKLEVNGNRSVMEIVDLT